MQLTWLPFLYLKGISANFVISMFCFHVQSNHWFQKVLLPCRIPQNKSWEASNLTSAISTCQGPRVTRFGSVCFFWRRWFSFVLFYSLRSKTAGEGWGCSDSSTVLSEESNQVAPCFHDGAAFAKETCSAGRIVARFSQNQFCDLCCS